MPPTLTLDFGFVKPAVSVGDFVWVDTNRNGVQDAGEPGIPGVTLRLIGPGGGAVTDVDGNAVGPVVTDATGHYLFPLLPALAAGQNYTAVLDGTSVALTGYIPTVTGQGTTATDSSSGTATSGDLTTNGAADLTLDFGFVTPSVSVGDFVWADTNGNGVQNAGEPGIPGVVLNLTGPGGAAVTDVFGNPVTPQTTTAAGAYLFANLPALPAGSHYTVSIDQAASAVALAGYTATVPGAGADRSVDSSTLTAVSGNLITDGSSDLTLDFGFVKPVSVGDFVWRDTNSNGIQDAGEPGIAGVVLKITDATGNPVTDLAGNPVGEITTNAAGGYSFTDLPPGTYIVTVDTAAPSTITALNGLASSPPGQGADRSLDSSTGSATSTAIPSGGADTSLDFGFAPAPTVSVGNFVWVDTNRDGLQTTGEPGIQGVVLTITGPDGTPARDVNGTLVPAQTTNAAGGYLFTGLPVLAAGQHYTVTIDQAASATALTPYLPTTPGVGADRSIDSSTGTATSGDLITGEAGDVTLDFGFVAARVSVGDFVWRDTDRDGIQDAGEPGLPGVTVVLTGPGGGAVTDVNGTTVAPRVTDSSGGYSFTDLPPLPAGQHYTVTVDTAASAAALNGWVPTVPGAGTDRGKDSTTGAATSTDLTTNNASDPSLDFGFVAPQVSVGDFVWIDSNGNGVQDAGEPGIAGVTLNLTGPAEAVTNVLGQPVGAATTDSSGHYQFTSLPVLPAGQHYTVTINSSSAALAGLAPTRTGSGSTATDSSTTSATSTDLTVDAANDPTLDFGFVKPVSVGDLVFADTNHDGIQQTGEPGIGGVVLELTDTAGNPVTDVNGTPVGEQTTDSDGHYSFGNLPPGTYVVTIDQANPSTITALTGRTPTLTGQGTPATDSSTSTATSALLTSGGTDTTLDFGFVPTPRVSVGDYVWTDSNRDGLQNTGEPGIAGVTLTLTGPGGGAVTNVNGAVVGATTTDAQGKYRFNNLPVLAAGQSYTVTIDSASPALAPYIPTTPLVGSDDSADSSTVSAASTGLTADGQSDLTLDFGFVKPAVTVGDFVFSDTNRNGIQDTGEPGLAGVTLTITGPGGAAVTNVNGAPVTTATTDGAGAYSFPLLPTLPAGQSYTVTITPPTGYIPTLTGQGTPATDSSTGSATTGDLTTNGATDTTLDFGFVKPRVSVGDFVWVDTDRDGLQDAGEAGIQGVVMDLTGPTGAAVTDINGNAVAPATTDVNGAYLFSGLPVLPAGQHYRVTIDPVGSAVALAPYIPTTAGAGADRAADSSTSTAVSTDLTADAQSDLTLDFGFVKPAVSVGDFVFKDLDRDGIQDTGEPGVAGVTLSIAGPGGAAVTNVNGTPVGPVTTGSDGVYLFPLLPALAAGQSYTVTVAPASPGLAGLVPTVAGAGTDRTKDSSDGSATTGNLTTNGATDTRCGLRLRRPGRIRR